LAQKLVAPVNGRAQSLVATGRTPTAADQELQPMVKTRCQLLRTEELESGGGSIASGTPSSLRQTSAIATTFDADGRK
jgi:hypothetical protein